jgi:hypothetical protein
MLGGRPVPVEFLDMCCEYLPLADVAHLACTNAQHKLALTLSLNSASAAPLVTVTFTKQDEVKDVKVAEQQKSYVSRRKNLHLVLRNGSSFNSTNLAINVCFRFTALERLHLRTLRSASPNSCLACWQSLFSAAESSLQWVELAMSGKHLSLLYCYSFYVVCCSLFCFVVLFSCSASAHRMKIYTYTYTTQVPSHFALLLPWFSCSKPRI